MGDFMARSSAKYTLSSLSQPYSIKSHTLNPVLYAFPIHQPYPTVIVELRSKSQSSGKLVNNRDSGPALEILWGWGNIVVL